MDYKNGYKNRAEEMVIRKPVRPSQRIGGWAAIPDSVENIWKKRCLRKTFFKILLHCSSD